MDLKNLFLMLGKNSKSLKLTLSVDFKASRKISGINLNNIQKLLKEISNKIENVKIDSNIRNFLD
ncbi:MAG: hypothetical protein BAJALOKI2v1_340037 [Promethearchaeota archaeon]|nr:MAG: hypothetical protein BAJALOKI2v1_340037 [Candidatus Lokiarchaeota archaeon]